MKKREEKEKEALIGRLLAALAVGLVVAQAYDSLLFGENKEWEFVLLDDNANFDELQSDLLQRSPVDPLTWRWVWNLVVIQVWEPLSWMIKIIVLQFWGWHSQGPRLASLLAHSLSAFLVYEIALVFSSLSTTSNGKESKPRIAKLERWSALCAACMFAIHPCGVEVVAWPSALPYAFCQFFLLLCVRFYLAGRQIRPAGSTLEGWVAPSSHLTVLVSSLCFLASVLCKSYSFFLIATFTLMEVILFDFPWKRVTLKQIVWLGLERSFFAVGTVLQFYHSFRETSKCFRDVLALGLLQRVAVATRAFANMVRVLLWPVNLSPNYLARLSDLTPCTGADGVLACCLVCVSAACLALMFLHRGSKVSASLFAWFLLALIPGTGLIQHGFAKLGSDRYVYISLPPMCILLAHLQNRIVSAASVRYLALLTTTLLFWIPVLAAFIYLDQSQVVLWKNSRELFQHMIKVAPYDWRAAKWYLNTLDRDLDQQELLRKVTDIHVLLEQELPDADFIRPVKRGLVYAEVLFRTNSEEACGLYATLATTYKQESFPDDVWDELLNNVAICGVAQRTMELDNVKHMLRQALAVAECRFNKDKIQTNLDRLEPFRDLQSLTDLPLEILV